MIDKNYCMSSYLAFRYIEKNYIDFCEGVHHKNIVSIPEEKRIFVRTAEDIDSAIGAVFDGLKHQKLGIMLSGGMDSAILASYLEGADAYTFRFEGGSFQQEELKRAETFAARNRMKLHYVDIGWPQAVSPLKALMQSKGAPVHSIEPQIFHAAIAAKADGVEKMIIGDAADYRFYGMDQLLSRDWTLNAFAQRYTCIAPEEVLREPVDISYAYERYRLPDDKIDFIGFYDDVITEESLASYDNAFSTAGMAYVDPYEPLKMVHKVDLARIRSGDSKYLIRELFRKKYPDIPVPDKNPMPRPVDHYFIDWHGPTRPEFRCDIPIDRYTGNQKWQLFCLEEFLNMVEPLEGAAT